MTQLQRAALLTALTEKLAEHGSWCGATHIQKAIYFLQEVFHLPIGFEFLLYKHGPYSFDLAEDLTWALAKYLLEKDYKTPGYGPGLKPTSHGRHLRQRLAEEVKDYDSAIGQIVAIFQAKGVAELEKLATALYVEGELQHGDTNRRAERLHQLKPHITKSEALEAVHELARILSKVRGTNVETE